MAPETERTRHPEKELHRDVYEANAAVIYEAMRWFLSESDARDGIQTVAAELQESIEVSGYTKYAKLVALKLVYDYVLKTKEANCEAFVGANKSETLTKHEAIPLLFHDKLDLPVDQIAGVLGISIGSVRTRMEKTRARLYRTADPAPSKLESRDHTCIRTKDWIEELSVQSVLALENDRSTIPAEIEKCQRCMLHLEHRLSSIHDFERRTHLLPEEFKRFPETHLILRDKGRTKFNWAAAPWYVKALLEGALATSLVLGIVLAVPRVKSLYELWLERRIDLYSLAELSTSLSTIDNDATSVAQNAPAEPAPQVNPVEAEDEEKPDPRDAKNSKSSGEHLNIKPESEFGGRESESASPNKIYRVFMKSDAPEGLRDSVMAVLAKYEHIAADQQVPIGTEIPGGIMFDVFVPLKSYKSIVNDLVPLGEMKVIITQSKERPMAGKARIKIWLQRI